MIIVFDGLCNFCNGWTRFVLKRDLEGEFMFAAAQSAAGVKILKQLLFPEADLKTIVLIDKLEHYEKSDAVLQILRHLGGGWRALSIFFLVPRALRDLCYSAFAQRRYKLLGSTAYCPTPDPKWRERFLN